MRQAMLTVFVVGTVLMVALAVPVPTGARVQLRQDVLFQLDRSTVQVRPGGSASVSLSLGRAGLDAEDVVLRHVGLVPTGVELSFDPVELVGAQGSSALRFTVEQGFPLTAFDVEIVADVGDVSVGQVLTVAVVDAVTGD